MTKKDYIEKVLSVMNEAGQDDLDAFALIGSDTAKVSLYVEDAFKPAWEMAVNIFPDVWLTKHDFSGNPVVADTAHGIGYVVLPDDYHQLSAFKMKGWHVPVREALPETDAVLRRQHNQYTRGSVVRPVCVLSGELIEGNEKKVLRYYSLTPGMRTHEIEKALYIPSIRELKDISPLEEISVYDNFINPLAYLNASIVFERFEKPNISQVLQVRAQTIYPIK